MDFYINTLLLSPSLSSILFYLGLISLCVGLLRENIHLEPRPLLLIFLVSPMLVRQVLPILQVINMFLKFTSLKSPSEESQTMPSQSEPLELELEPHIESSRPVKKFRTGVWPHSEPSQAEVIPQEGQNINVRGDF
jgi:hypothetical protein